jgi:agmatinase
VSSVPRISLVGIGTDRNSSFLRGPAKAPAAIRQALRSPSANTASESGADIFTDLGLAEGFDVKIAEDKADVAQIQAAIFGVLAAGAKPLSLGGDHSITFPIMQAFAARGIKPHILHFDAHPDLYDDFEGNFYSHASPFARIMESGLASSLTQIGIRTANRHQRDQAKKFGVTMIEMAQHESWRGALPAGGPLYVSVDLDALDPAFAPGVSHHEPGGLSVRQVLEILHVINGPVVGADLVEYNPDRDINGMTAMVAAKIVKELVEVLAR